MFTARYGLNRHVAFRNIPPTLHTHLHLHVAPTTRTNGPSLGTFQKQCSFWNQVTIDIKVGSLYFKWPVEEPLNTELLARSQLSPYVTEQLTCPLPTAVGQSHIQGTAVDTQRHTLTPVTQ